MIGKLFGMIYQNLLHGLKKWQMLFNTSKCKVMHVGKSQKHYPYYMNSQQLEEVTQEKDLGILINNDKVSQQCQAATSKATRILGIIKRVPLCSDILILCYASTSHIVRPHLEYCTAAWSPHYCKDKELIEKVQRRFIRMIRTET